MHKTNIWKSVISILTACLLTVSSVCQAQAGELDMEGPAQNTEQTVTEEGPWPDESTQEGEGTTETTLDTKPESPEPAEPSTAVSTEIPDSTSWTDTKDEEYPVDVPSEEREPASEQTATDEQTPVEEPAEGVQKNQKEELVGEAEKPDTVEDPTVLTGEHAADLKYSSGKMRWTGSPSSPFRDVKDTTQAYYNAICWAGNTGIAKGYSDGTFRSGNKCTRGDTIMLIWKFKGKPAPKYVPKSPFKDVPMKNTFYQAVLWAYQSGITKGYGDGTFGINKICSSGQAMTFLWRAAGKPQYNAPAKSPFSDISASNPYYKAVCWGSGTGITKGFPNGSFGTNMSCTRGHIATFLYRQYLNKFCTVKQQDGKVKNIVPPIARWNNTKYVKILTKDKTTINVPAVPKKVLFIGNSLLQGLGSAESGGRFGMCATDSRHDYYHLVTSAILKKNPKAEFSKMSGTAFEGSTDLNTAGKWYLANRKRFTADVNLVIIQLGDNVNENSKQTAFSKNIEYLIPQIKADCPKARVICVGTWYRRPTVIKDYIRVCKENGCDFVSIEDVYSADTLPKKGTVVTYNNGTTRIAEGGSLIHPNNEGMSIIAKRILAQMNM